VVNISDKFGNVISSNNRDTFIGQPADTSGPRVEIANGTAYNKVEIRFNEELDQSSAEDASNYSINNDLTVIAAQLTRDDDDDDRIVELITDTQKAGEVYRITVSDVRDEFGNKVESRDYAYFAGVELEDVKPRVLSAYADVISGKTYVFVTFDEDMDEDATEIGSNFYFGSEIGYGISADQVDSSNRYKVRVNELDDTTRYTVTVKRATDLSGNTVDSDHNDATFVGKSVSDDDETEILTAFTLNQKTIMVIFNRKMNGEAGVQNKTQAEENPDKTVANNPYDYVLIDRDASETNRRFIVESSYLEDDYKTVVLTLESPLKSGHTYELYLKADGTHATEMVEKIDENTDPFEHSNSLGIQSEDMKNPLLVDNATFIVGGSSREVEPLKIDNVYTTSSSTVTMMFNKEVQINDYAPNGVTFEHSSVNSSNDKSGLTMAVDPNDDRILLVRISGEFESTGTYTAAVGGNILKEKFTGVVKTTSLKASDEEFHASTQDVLEPSIAEAFTIADGTVKAIFTKDMDDFMENEEIYSIKYGNTVASDVNFVEFEEDRKNTMLIYFDNSKMSMGRVYTLEVSEGNVKDILEITADDDQEVEFSIISSDKVDSPEVLEVRNIGDDEYQILFSEPVVFASENAIKIGTDTLTFTSAYENGDKVVLVSGATPTEEYVDELTFKLGGIDGTSLTLVINEMSNKIGIPAESEDLSKTFKTIDVRVTLTTGSLGVPGNKEITGLVSGMEYEVTVDSLNYGVKADGTLGTAGSSPVAIVGTKITGLDNSKTYFVADINVPSVIMPLTVPLTTGVEDVAVAHVASGTIRYIKSTTDDLSEIVVSKKITDEEVTSLGTVLDTGAGLNVYENNGMYIVALEINPYNYVVAKGVSSVVDEGPLTLEPLIVTLVSGEPNVVVEPIANGTVNYILNVSGDVSEVVPGKKITDAEIVSLGMLSSGGTGLNVAGNNDKYVVAIEVDESGYVLAIGVSAAIAE
jgi:hypothetical protein